MDDLTGKTNAELYALNDALQREFQRRQAPQRLAALFAEYDAGDPIRQVLAAEAQRLADQPPAEPVPTRETT